VVYPEVQTGLAMNDNDNEPLTSDERAELERFRRHQAQFKERRMLAGYCRWMASRYRGIGVPATADKPPTEPPNQ
jgi:hypothetical protein